MVKVIGVCNLDLLSYQIQLEIFENDTILHQSKWNLDYYNKEEYII